MLNQEEEWGCATVTERMSRDIMQRRPQPLPGQWFTYGFQLEGKNPSLCTGRQRDPIKFRPAQKVQSNWPMERERGETSVSLWDVSAMLFLVMPFTLSLASSVLKLVNMLFQLTKGYCYFAGYIHTGGLTYYSSCWSQLY